MKTDWPKLITSLFLCLGAGFAGSLVTYPALDGWYASLSLPAFSPPSWIFGPVWTVLYVLMAIALYRVWSKESDKKSAKNVDDALHWFWLQLALNVAWSYLFFGLKKPLPAFFDIVFLWIAIFLTIKSFGKVDRNASLLLAPYLLWIFFAAILNLSVWLLNP